MLNHPRESSPPTQPCPRTRLPSLHQLLSRLKLAYYRYEVTFGLYVMTTVEKTIFNALMLTFAALLFTAIIYVFPVWLFRRLRLVLYSLFGDVLR